LIITVFLLSWLPRILNDKIPWHLNNDFAHYYITADLMGHGVDPYGVDLKSLYPKYGFTPDHLIARATNPPTLTLITIPLSWIAPQKAFLMWSFLAVVCLILAIYFCCKITERHFKKSELIILCVAGLVTFNFYSHVKFAQSQALVILLTIYGIYKLLHGVDKAKLVGAFIIGVGASLKLFTVPLVIPVILSSGVMGGLLFLAGFLTLWIPSGCLIGFSGIENFLFQALPYINSVSHNFSGNLSFAGALVNSYKSLGQGLLGENIKIYFNLFSFIATGGVLSCYWLKFRKTRITEYDFYFMLGVILLFGPISWTHYFILLYPGLIGCAALLSCQYKKLSYLAVTLFGYLLIGSATGYQAQADTGTGIISAWWGVFALMVYLYLVWASKIVSKRLLA